MTGTVWHCVMALPRCSVLVNNQGEWNLDVAELEYNPTLRDMNDAKYHHLLASEYKPMKRVRKEGEGGFRDEGSCREKRRERG